jgi:membrane protein
VRLAREQIVPLGKRLLTEVKEDDVSGLAAELAYRFFLSLFPFFIFLAALGGFVAGQLNVDDPTNEVMDLLGDSVPSDVASVLRTEVDGVIGSQNVGLVSIGILASIWAASSGVATLIKGMNRIYAVREGRPFWKRYAVALGLTVLAGGLLIGAFLLLVVGQVYGLRIANELAIEGIAADLLTLARWPLVVVTVLVTVAFLYWAAPNAKLPFRLLTPGSVVFGIAWLVLNYLFGLYISNLGNYNATYGTLGGVVIVLLWFYITGFALLLGAEINVVLMREDATAVEKVAPAESEAEAEEKTAAT